MKRRLVVATDLSPHCERLERQAIAAAAEHQAEAIFVHVTEVVPAPLMTVFLEARRRALAAAEERLQGWAEAQGVTVRLVAREGDPVAEVLAAAEEFDAWRLVVGSHVHEPLKDLFLGRHARKLVRRSTRPTWVVRPEAPEGEGILVLVDLSPISERVVAAAAEQAPEGELEVLYCFETPYMGLLEEADTPSETVVAYLRELSTAAQQELEGWVARLPDAVRGRVRPITDVGPAAEQALEHLRRRSRRLVALGRTGKGAARGLGGTVETLLDLAPVDLLVVPEA